MSDEPITRVKCPTRLTYVVTPGRVTDSFLRHILERRLVGRRCPACEKVYLPPRGSCPTCAVPCTTEVEVAHTGVVTTFSVIRFPFEGQLLPPPYACAHILIDGTDVPMLHLIGECPPAEVRMGMRVEAVWSEVPAATLASIRFFRPIDEPDASYESFREHV